VITECPFKVGQKIEGKDAVPTLLGFGIKDIWYVCIVEKVDGNLMQVVCPNLYGEVKPWINYHPDWFREFKEKEA